MNNDLVETVRHCFTNEVVNQLSAQVGATKLGVTKALDRAVPPVLNGLLRQIERANAPETLLDLVRAVHEAEVLTHLAPSPLFAWNERVANLLQDLLGDSYRPTVSRIAHEASIRPTASGTLLQAATTAALGVLGKFAVENDLTPSGLVHWVRSQKEAIGASMLPPLGFSSPQVVNVQLATTGPDATPQPALELPRGVLFPSGVAEPHQEERWVPAPTVARGSTGAERWKWGGLALLAVGCGYFLGREALDGDSPSAAQPVAVSSPVAVTPAPVPAAPIAVTVAPVTVPAALVAPPVAAPVTVGAAPVTAPTPAPVPAPARVLASASVPAPAPNAPKAANLPASGPPAIEAASPRPLDKRPTPAVRPVPVANADTHDSTRDAYVHNTGRPTVLTLAKGGGTANVGAAPTEVRLSRALAAFATQADSASRPSAWIDFDQVHFEPGQATLTPESMQQLANVARVLKAFPNVVVKVGGYADSTGAGPQDLRFSEARARSVTTALANQGVRLYRLFAQGYGAKHAMTPNTTPANRAMNRYVSIRVLRKHM